MPPERTKAPHRESRWGAFRCVTQSLNGFTAGMNGNRGAYDGAAGCPSRTAVSHDGSASSIALNASFHAATATGTRMDRPTPFRPSAIPDNAGTLVTSHATSSPHSAGTTVRSHEITLSDIGHAPISTSNAGTPNI